MPLFVSHLVAVYYTVYDIMFCAVEQVRRHEFTAEFYEVQLQGYSWSVVHSARNVYVWFSPVVAE